MARSREDWEEGCNSEQGYSVMTWPPYSPDLNSIEMVWYVMKTWIAKHHPEIQALSLGEERTKAAIVEAVQLAWDAVGEDYLWNLMKSMPRRVQDVIKAQGGYTKY